MPRLGYPLVVLPHAVLLDLDGTLVDSEPFHAESIARYMAGHGITLDERERAFVIGHGWREIHAELRVHERLGVDLTGLQAGSGHAKIGMRAEGFSMKVLEGARELVELLSELAIPTAIVSGSSRAEIGEALDELGFAERLHFWLGAEDYPRGKPAPDGYLHAVERLVVAPARTLVFEDSRAGIASGLAAGMRVIATAAANPPPGTPGHQDQSRAHLRLADLRGIDHELLRRAMTELA